MLSRDNIKSQIVNVLDETNYAWLGTRYIGKVRDNYTVGDTRVQITTDRLSCFDRIVTSIPFKGHVLNTLAAFWFEHSKEVIPNHVIEVPHPNAMIVKRCEVVPIEVVVRGYLTGSAWRDYVSGKAVSGVSLPPGLKAFQKLERPIITPSTKAPKGDHDEPISESEIVQRGIVPKKLWDEIRAVALSLFDLGTKLARGNGLILADTKYEFGLADGRLTLIDEVHTLDSSRYWVVDTYEQKLKSGEAPEMLDKEPTRQWLLTQGFKGDGPIPAFSDDHRVDISLHYINSFKRISGQEFEAAPGPVNAELESVLRKIMKKFGTS